MPEYIKNTPELMKLINEIKDEQILKDGGTKWSILYFSKNEIYLKIL